MAINTGDKKTRITLRVNDEQFEFVKSNADFLGVSPSEFLRMVINSALVASKTQPVWEEVKKGAAGRANDKAIFNDIV